MDIAKLKELVAAATPGPWDCDPFRGEDISLESRGIELGMVFAGKNAALIVAAVNALPELLAKVEAAEKLWCALGEALSDVEGSCAAISLTTYDGATK